MRQRHISPDILPIICIVKTHVINNFTHNICCKETGHCPFHPQSTLSRYKSTHFTHKVHCQDTSQYSFHLQGALSRHKLQLISPIKYTVKTSQYSFHPQGKLSRHKSDIVKTQDTHFIHNICIVKSLLQTLSRVKNKLKTFGRGIKTYFSHQLKY